MQLERNQIDCRKEQKIPQLLKHSLHSRVHLGASHDLGMLQNKTILLMELLWEILYKLKRNVDTEKPNRLLERAQISSVF